MQASDFNEFLKNLFAENPFLVSIILFFLAVFLGLFSNRLINFIKNSYVIRRKIKTTYDPRNKKVSLIWHSTKIALSTIQKFVILWFILLGLYGVLLTQPYIKVTPSLESDLQTFLFITFILTIVWAIIRIVNNIVRARAQKLGSTSIILFFVNITIVMIGISIILESQGIEITALLTAFGIAGLAVAFALKDTLENFFAGLHIVASGQLKVGNYIKLETGEEGYIVDVNWRSTTLRSIQNYIIIIPNIKIVSAIITNYNLPSPPTNFPTEVGVSYDSDLEKVERITLEVAKEIQNNAEIGGDPSFEPKLRYHTFADFSINFRVVLRAIEYEMQYKMKNEFVKKLHKRYNEEGIEIPFPIRTIINKKS